MSHPFNQQMKWGPVYNIFCLKEIDHDMLCSTYKDGLLLGEGRDINEQINSVIKEYLSTMFTLVSLEKVIPVEEIVSG
jgi:hypothetical protein